LEKQKRSKLQNRFEERHRKDLEKLATLSQKISALDNELAQSRVESADTRNSEAQERIRLREELSKVLSENRHLKSELSTSQTKEFKSCELLEQSRLSVAKMEIEMKRLSNQEVESKQFAEQLESSLEKLRLEYARSQNERGQAKALQDHAQAECNRLEKENASLRKLLESSRSETKHLKTRVKSLETDVVKHKKKIALNEDEITRTNALVSQKNDELQSILKRVQNTEEESLKKDERIHVQAEHLEETKRKLDVLEEQRETISKREAVLLADSQSMKQTLTILRQNLKQQTERSEIEENRSRRLSTNLSVLKEQCRRLKAMAQLRESQKELEVLSKSTFSAAESMRELLKTISSKETKDMLEDDGLMEDVGDGTMEVGELVDNNDDDDDDDDGEKKEEIVKVEKDDNVTEYFQGDIKVGDIVEARFGPKKKRWYPGKVCDVTRVAKNDWRFSVQFTDGDAEVGLQRCDVRKPERILPGTSVMCWWNDTRWFSGVVQKSDSDGNHTILYADGEKETGVKRERVRALEPLKINTLVETRMYRGHEWAHHHPSNRLPARVVQTYPDASCDVIFQDGVKEHRVPRHHVWVWKKSGSV